VGTFYRLQAVSAGSRVQGSTVQPCLAAGWAVASHSETRLPHCVCSLALLLAVSRRLLAVSSNVLETLGCRELNPRFGDAS